MDPTTRERMIQAVRRLDRKRTYRPANGGGVLGELQTLVNAYDRRLEHDSDPTGELIRARRAISVTGCILFVMVDDLGEDVEGWRRALEMLDAIGQDGMVKAIETGNFLPLLPR